MPYQKENILLPKITFTGVYLFLHSYVISVLLIPLLFFTLVGCDFTWQRYYNKEYRFSILLPRSWQKQEGLPNNIIILAKAPLKGRQDKLQENINVVVTDFPGKISLSTFFELNKEEVVRIFPGVIYDVSEGDIFAGRYRGRWFAFSCKLQDANLRIISAAWMKGNRVYVITCSGQVEEYPKYKPIFDKILRSLRIK